MTLIMQENEETKAMIKGTKNLERIHDQKIQEEYERRLEVEAVRRKYETKLREKIVQERSKKAVELMTKFKSSRDSE